MVFFTCNACGESLKKAQVDKHVNMCRGCQVLSCIDCGKDFWGDDYKDHVRCISEDQKYGGKGYEAKSNKGDVKQQQWIQKIHDAMNKPGITPKLKDVLQQVSSYDNVPRKKAKFQNWMKNSLKIHNPSLHDQVWDIFSAATSNTPETPKHTTVEEVKVEEVKVEEVTREVVGAEVNGGRTKLSKRERKEARRQNNGNIQRRPSDDSADTQEQQNGKKESKKERKRKRRQEEEEEQNGHVDQSETTTTAVKKRKKSIESDKVKAIEEQTMDQTTDETGEDAASKGKFNWKGTIKALLRQSPEEGLSVKKLRKKVLAAYYSFSGENNFKTEADLLAILNKKINSNPKFRVLKDKVRLVK